MGDAPVAVDLSEFAVAEQDLLVMLLRADKVPFDLRGETLFVPADRAEQARSMGEASREHPDVRTNALPSPVPRATAATVLSRSQRGETAARWQRFVGFWIDSTAISIGGRLIFELGG